MRHEYLTLEHLLLALTREPSTREVLDACGANVKRLRERLENFLDETVERLPEGVDAEPQQTIGVERVLQRAAIHALSAEQKVIDGGDVLVAIFREEESHALYLLQQEGVTRLDLLNYISHGISKDGPTARTRARAPGGLGDDEDGGSRKEPARGLHREPQRSRPRRAASTRSSAARRSWSAPSRCSAAGGRTTRSTWARPGVGKTAIAEGLALRIHEGKVPERAARARSSTRWTWARCSRAPSSAASSRSGSRACSRRCRSSPDAILFIDEIHTIVGAGATSGGSHGRLQPPQAGAGLGQAALHRLAPRTRSTRRRFERDRALSRRFQKIEVGEPSVEDTVLILEGLKSRYEEHHGVKYDEDAIRAAAELVGQAHQRPVPAGQGHRRDRRDRRGRAARSPRSARTG